MHRFARIFATLSTALAPVIAAGCAGADPEAPEVDGGDVVSEGLAVVALTWRADPGSATNGASGTGLAQAYVIDHAPGQRAAALELLSLPSAALALDTSLGSGECRVDGPRGQPGMIVLRDAGEIAVEADLGVNVLDSSWLPEGSLDISGIAYAGVLAPRTRGPLKPIQVVADGSPEVGPFTVQLTPPRAVRLLAVGGHEVARGRVKLDERDLTQHLDVAWEPGDVADAEPAGGSPTVAVADLTVVVFERRTFGATWTISCVAADDGFFSVPAGALLALPDLGPDRTDSVIVRRIASASFSARHVPEGMALAVSEDQAYVE